MVQREPEKTYREEFGLQNPPPGTQLEISFMEGIQFYLIWNECPDDENIIQGWFPSRGKAESYAKEKGYQIKN